MHNNVWVKKRLEAIIKYYGAQFFNGKTVLDIGPGYGDFSVALTELGANVTCVDAKKQHLDKIIAKNHNIRCVVADLDQEWPFANEYFDLILHLGTLNHLSRIEQHLANVLISSNYLVLDTQVCDSSDPSKIPLIKENKLNILHSHSGIGCRPSIGYLENLLNKNGLVYERILDSSCNSNEFIYDWVSKNLGMVRDGLSRMWFAKRYTLSTSPYVITKENSSKTVLEHVAPRHAVEVPRVITTPIEVSAKPIETVVVPVPVVPLHTHRHPYVAPGRQKIRLFYNYYMDGNQQRKQEIDHCLQKNIDNQFFELIIIGSDEVPTYDFFFGKINNLVEPDDISVISHSDIFFDQTISLIKNMPHQTLYALTRYEWHQNRPLEFSAADNKHDTLIVRGPIKNVVGNFKMGRPNSSGRIAYEFGQAGYAVLNPSRSIKTYHYHDCGIRTYSADDIIPGPVLVIPPCSL